MFWGDTNISRHAKSPKLIRVGSLVIMCIIPTVQLAVGAMYKNDCPQQPYIPIYLMVIGIITLLSSFCTIASNFTFGSLYTVCSGLSCLVSLFLCCWFIAGNVWIYSIYEPNYNKTTTGMEPYCDKTLYLFAFWTTNITYILLGLMILSLCPSCVVVIKRQQERENV